MKNKALCFKSIFPEKVKIKNQKVFWKVKNGHFKMSKNDFPKKILDFRFFSFSLSYFENIYL
jgi:hypothetical protein